MSNGEGAKAARDVRALLNNVSDPLKSVRDLLMTRDDVVYAERPFMTDMDGAYAYDDKIKKGFIYVNARPIWTRRRFTMAHELGHHILGHRERVDQDVMRDVYDSAEVEANAFAAELLMPSAALRETTRIYGAEEVAELAGHFMVSARAMIVRLSALGLINNALKRDLDNNYDVTFYRNYLDQSPDRDEIASTKLPDEFTSSVFALYKAGEIGRDAVIDALDLTRQEADESLPPVDNDADFLRTLHSGVSGETGDRRNS